VSSLRDSNNGILPLKKWLVETDNYPSPCTVTECPAIETDNYPSLHFENKFAGNFSLIACQAI
jgi:hypothetical protein